MAPRSPRWRYRPPPLHLPLTLATAAALRRAASPIAAPAAAATGATSASMAAWPVTSTPTAAVAGSAAPTGGKEGGVEQEAVGDWKDKHEGDLPANRPGEQKRDCLLVLTPACPHLCSCPRIPGC